jgi:hypothetical protein
MKHFFIADKIVYLLCTSKMEKARYFFLAQKKHVDKGNPTVQNSLPYVVS